MIHIIVAFSIPKGGKNGFEGQLFVMVTDNNLDKVQEYHGDCKDGGKFSNVVVNLI